MRIGARLALGGMLLVSVGCSSDRGAPLAMRVVVLNAAALPDGAKWNELLGRPLVEVEYSARPGADTGGRTLVLYDARSGECRTVIHAPISLADPMSISWAPCK